MRDQFDEMALRIVKELWPDMPNEMFGPKDYEYARRLRAELAKAEPAAGLRPRGFGDDDGRWGMTVEEYVTGCSDSHDYDGLISGEPFAVTAQFYRDEQWRTVSISPIKCERVDDAPVAPSSEAPAACPSCDGWMLAMRVLQSGLYRQLNDQERAVCDALVATNPYASQPIAPATPAPGRQCELTGCMIGVSGCALQASSLTASLNVTGVFSLNDKTKYTCPVHGVTTKNDPYIGRAIDRTPHISVSLYGTPRYHCLLCYAEWLDKTIPRLEEMKP